MKKLLSLTVVLVMIMAILPPAGISVSAAGIDSVPVSTAPTGLEALSIEGTDTLYDEFADDYDDPNWVTDEQLFGVWDGSSWTTESLLNYEKYSEELGEVEAAVKAGDYQLAKELITEYYRQKFLAQPRTITKTSATSSLISAKMMCYNMQSNGTLYDIATLTQDERLIKMDITAAAQSAANSTSGKEYSFQITATHDDGYPGYMYSRESDFVPYVEANVDGNMMTFPVIADTYIRGGQYKNINYGTSATNPDNKLLIEEHVDYSQSSIGYPAYYFTHSDVILDDVCRPRLTVDFSSLAAGSTVNSAKLCFVGATDNPDGKTITVAYEAGFRGNEDDTSWSWSGLSEDGRSAMSYWGIAGAAAFAGDNSTRYNRNIAANWGKGDTLAKVYRYTNDETYAYHAFRYLNAQVNEQGYDPLVAARGSGTWKNHLSCATRSSSIPETIAHLAPSEHFTAENFIPLLKYAYSSGEALVRCWDSTSQGTNWGTYETAGLSNLAVNFKEFRVVDDPMIEGGVYGVGNTGGWIALINHRYYIISGTVIRPDDSFTESMGYGKETFNNFLKYPKYAEQAGEPVTLEQPLADNMNKLASYIITVAGPRFTSNQYGDSYGYGSVFASVAMDAAKLTGDPFLTWVGTYGKEGTPPDFTSKMYPDNRHAALKTGWGINDLYMNFTADQGEMHHNHPDDLHVSLFAYGDPLLVDSMQYSYGVNAPERNAVYATAMHNTLSIKITDPNTGLRENLTHIANISAIYSGPYPVYSEFLPKENWPNAWFNREVHNGIPGTVHTYELNNGYDHVEMSHKNYENWTRTGYPYARSNVNMKRSVLMLRKPKYVIVTDYVKALDDEPYTVAQNWHFHPTAGFNETDNPDVIEEFKQTGVAKTSFSGKANLQIIPVKAQSQLEYVYEKEGYYCRTQGVIQNNPYPAYEKHGSGDKVFNTVLLPTSGGQNIESSALNLQMDVPETVATASRITMTDVDLDQTREVYYYFLHDESQKAQRDFGKYSTDSKMALVEYYGGAPSMIIVQNGTNVRDNSEKKYVLKSGDIIEELSVTFESGNMYLDTSKELNLETLTIRSESSVSQVFLNNEPIQFRQANNYIYFGDEPILADDETETPEDDTAINVPSHGSNSGGGSGGGSSEKEDPKPEDPQPEDPKPETPSSDAFKDELQGHWGEEEIASLIDAGIIKGDGGKLNLKNTVTRAELIALIIRAMGLEEKEYNGEFSDVTADDWYAGVIATAKSAGFVDGDGEMVMPNDPVTREQMAKFLILPYILKNPEAQDGEVLTFADSEEISSWAVNYVNKATALGILNGMGDGTFAPKNAVLREQAFAAIARLMK